MQTIQQQRAKHALDRVYRVLGKNGDSANQANQKGRLTEKELKEFRAHTQGLPFMIHANGLGQAYAFYLANCGTDKEPKKSYRAICDILAEWLLADGQPYAGRNWHGKNPREKLLEAITRQDQRTYLLAQAEAIAYMSWVKRFADAFIIVNKKTPSAQDSVAETHE